MSQEERWNDRDLTYSAWHRPKSTGRFVGIEKAQLLAMIDLDVCLYVEYDDATKDPVMLAEVARDIGQEWKTATVTQRLAERANIPAFTVLYTLANHSNPSDERWSDIYEFRVRMIYPYKGQWERMIPRQWAEKLLQIRLLGSQAVDQALKLRK